MTCTVSPITNTSTAELQRLRGGLTDLYGGLRSRTSVSTSMRRSVALASAAITRNIQLTCPLVLTEKADKLDLSGNVMLYTLKADQSFKLVAHLPLEYISVTNTLDTLVLYSKEQQENKTTVRYAAVIRTDVSSVDIPLPKTATRPEKIPLCPQDADFNKSILPTALGLVLGKAGTDHRTVTLSFFKSVKGEAFVPHTVSRYGWTVASGTDTDKLLLGADLSSDQNMSYPVNELQPYGSFFKDCRPPGYKPEWGRVATKEYSLALMEAEAPRAVDTCAQVKGLVGYDNLKDALVNGSLVTLRYESGGLLYLPVNLFEIRPQVGSTVARVNVVDEGPPRKTPKGKDISNGYRPAGTTYYSAGGNYQYVQGTWETYAKRYSQMFGVTTGLQWLWEAPPQAQVWYQIAYMTENFYKNTAGVTDIFPPFYYAIMVHANNIGNSMSYKFLRAARTAIQRERAQTPGYNTHSAHLTCKRIYEQKTWLISKHADYMNRILDVLKRELPLINPTLYPNNMSLYPGHV